MLVEQDLEQDLISMEQDLITRQFNTLPGYDLIWRETPEWKRNSYICLYDFCNCVFKNNM
jgi:hypothetical protein